MARQKRWTTEISNGIWTVRLSGWRYFADYINLELLDYGGYVYRGQGAAHWGLVPTLDRLLRHPKKAFPPTAREDHLAKFRMAVRGRRGSSPPQISTDNEWWAIGQHHGLATPLLDWSTSPYVAAYFAFATDGNDGATERAVFALHRPSVETKSRAISDAHKGLDRPNIIEFVAPLSDENPRLVNQGGLFSRAPDGIEIQDWVAQQFAGDNGHAYLLKITIPNRDRELCLRNLNRMNINHLTLFPDLYGASKYCNFALAVDKY
jgi:hypothetical protein